MRHGRRSASQRFNGHKAAVAVEMESQLITGVEVLAGNAGDQEKALELVQQSERVLEAKVEETVGDCAYGGGPTRRVFAEEERILTAKVPASHNRNCFSKSEFEIDLDQMELRCPAGQSTRDYRSAGEGRGGQFLFSQACCQACPLRLQCVRGQGPRSAEVGMTQDRRNVLCPSHPVATGWSPVLSCMRATRATRPSDFNCRLDDPVEPVVQIKRRASVRPEDQTPPKDFLNPADGPPSSLARGAITGRLLRVWGSQTWPFQMD